MILYPAIDIKGGQCVRLLRGSAESATLYHDDPVEVAENWARQGAEWLHVVDLDGAFTGELQNLVHVHKICRAVRIPVQFGGGIRSSESLEKTFAAGVKRAVIGTSALEGETFLSRALHRYGNAIAAGVDSKDGWVATHGWQKQSAAHVRDLAQHLSTLGVERIVCTDIHRDGTLSGPNFEVVKEIAHASGLKVILSGGVATLDDIKIAASLEPLGVEGVIVGKALYEKNFSLADALEVARRHNSYVMPPLR